MAAGKVSKRDVTLVTLKMDKEGHAWTKECGQLEAGKGKETDSPLEGPEKNAALWISWFLAQWDSRRTSADL